MSASPTAAVLVIGDEILSGRTQDLNLRTLARFLGPLGIDLAEARFVPDSHCAIVAAVNALRTRYDYLFTTGGIGPTHDDITADAIGEAFARPVVHNTEAMALLARRYRPEDFNDARKRMARMPEGAILIRNPVSAAPGFQVENVLVLAGVPKIMEAMLDDIAPRLRTGVPIITRTLSVPIPEGRIATALGLVQERHPAVSIGSYPFFAGLAAGPTHLGTSGTSLVLRGRHAGAVADAEAELIALVRAQGLEPERK
jgi:molybdenum cofactor synthesis domain-containing protein